MEKDNEKLQVFISYQTTDKEVATKLKEMLVEFGVEVFLSAEDIETSAKWNDVILESLKSSSVFFCLLSKNYVKSPFCMQESGVVAFLEKTEGRDVVPLSIDGTVPSGFLFGFQAGRINPAEFSFEDVAPKTLTYSRDRWVELLIERLGNSYSFNNAKANFKLILPYLDKLTKEQVELFYEKIITNKDEHFHKNQITNDSDCKYEYIPKFIEVCGSLLNESEIETLKSEIS
ncbi:MAG: toll/interleukin-1 receptor domain-containing protein [Bifidobacteriaceae bacterium]|jgi:hypothetical protein|nr:toll/interleukin-1 receptor domain-containing protein [Bifidobacteriaceae bacterium]